MQKNAYWIGLVVFLVAAVVAYTIYFRDFQGETLLLSQTVCPPVYRALAKANRRVWLVPCTLGLALALGGFYFLADWLVFPHSPRAAHRFHDACVNGLLWAFYGFLIAWIWNSLSSSPDNRATTKPTH